jgi:5-formyltetrahydrofolate cyclo-ligase
MSDHHGFIPSSAEDLLRRRVKAEIRKRMRGLRRSMPLEVCNERSAKIVAALEPMLREARSVALFYPIVERHEVDLRALDGSLRARGVKVAYPALDQETNVMSFRFVDDPEAMEERGKGFREPGNEAPLAEQLDVIVVPALAIDPRGYRIGYGAGYYDRTLPRFAAKTIGVAFDFQLVSEIGETEGDVTVQHVVTDARALTAA